jgi:hypothetical protein
MPGQVQRRPARLLQRRGQRSLLGAE